LKSLECGCQETHRKPIEEVLCSIGTRFDSGLLKVLNQQEVQLKFSAGLVKTFGQDLLSQEALKQFNGTLILVSHDRDFLQGLTSTVFGFKDKVIKEYLGDIEYFLEQHKMENLREAEKRTVVKAKKDTSKDDAHQLSRDQEKELRKLKNKRSKIETQISDLETEITKIDLALAENYDEVSSQPNFFENYKTKKAQLESLMSDWELVEEEIEKIFITCCDD